MSLTTRTRLSDPDVLRQCRDWYRSGARVPFVVDDVLEDAAALRVGRLFQDVDGWRHHATVSISDRETVEVDPADWDRHELRSARHFKNVGVGAIVRDTSHPSEARRALVALMQGVILGGELQHLLGPATGVPLSSEVGSIELAAYGQGDEIKPHSDAGLGRAFAANFYLDPDLTEHDGTWLWYRPDLSSAATGAAPLFNRLAIIETRPDSEHWVGPRTASGRGRFTVSVGVQHAVPTGGPTGALSR